MTDYDPLLMVTGEIEAMFKRRADLRRATSFEVKVGLYAQQIAASLIEAADLSQEHYAALKEALRRHQQQEVS